MTKIPFEVVVRGQLLVAASDNLGLVDSRLPAVLAKRVGIINTAHLEAMIDEYQDLIIHLHKNHTYEDLPALKCIVDRVTDIKAQLKRESDV